MTTPLNSDYGNGVFRRRILLRNESDCVAAELEDCFHAFRVRLGHDGARITTINSEAIRYPVTTCPGSTLKLRDFIGAPLSADRRALRELQNPKQHCTHQYDLVWLAMAQALRGTPRRQYDIEVADERDGATDVRVLRDGEQILCWPMKKNIIAAPEIVAGKSPYREFGKWANAIYSGELLEAAYVAQICAYIATARKLDLTANAGTPLSASEMDGVCYTYQPEHAGNGIHTSGMLRDFTDSPDQLLKFL